MEEEETFLGTMARVLNSESALSADALRCLAVRLWFQAKRSLDNKFLKEICTSLVWSADELDRDDDKAKRSAMFRNMIKPRGWGAQRKEHKAANGPAI